MSRKDYKRAAKLIRELFLDCDEHGIIFSSKDIVNLFVDFFEEDNDRFDAQKFRKACNGQA